MTDRDAFLAAVRDRPDDDLPRLVFADWLEEHGEPDRAGFIRTQCSGAAEGRPGVGWKVRVGGGGPTRFGHLVAARPWADPAVLAAAELHPGWVQATSSSAAVLWRRGFVEAVLCSGVSLGPQLAALAAHPVHEVVLTLDLPYRVSGRPGRGGCGVGRDRREGEVALRYRCREVRVPGVPGPFDPTANQLLLAEHLTTAPVVRFAFRRPGRRWCPFGVVRAPPETARV